MIQFSSRGTVNGHFLTRIMIIVGYMLRKLGMSGLAGRDHTMMLLPTKQL